MQASNENVRQIEDGGQYTAEYFASSCGPIPYERSSHWVKFFFIIADQIIRALQPRRVLDAGCAFGLLVEAFWDRAVYCEGIDVSEYAISQVRRDMAPYCRVQSLLDPIVGRFDLVTCLEVLEHISPTEAEEAVRNLCSASDTILFSSTPNDFLEPTHVNVRPPLYWLQLFADFGFWPDAQFDASFITPHAMLLKKGKPPEHDFLRLFSESIRYKTAVLKRDLDLAQANQAVTELPHIRTALEVAEKRIHTLTGNLAENLRAVSDLTRDLETLRAEKEQTERFANDLKRELANTNETSANRLSLMQELSGKLQSQALRWELFRSDADACERDLRSQNEALRNECADHAVRLDQLIAKNHDLRTTLDSVFTSKGWKLAELCRWPLRRLRSLRTAARHSTGHPVEDDSSPVAASKPPAYSTTEQISDSSAQGRLRKAAPDCGYSLDSNYQRWIDEQEPTAEELHTQRVQVNTFVYKPLISIVVPSYATDHAMLRACIESVRNQTYPNWELCVAIVASVDNDNLSFLEQFAAHDSRMRIIELPTNAGISSNSNAALDLATGEFVALLDHDDTLAPFALFALVAHLQIDRSADVLYSDHDYLNESDGLRCDPLFKPAWSPETMFSANYITHLCALRRSLINQVGRFDPQTDGAQDWDLFLKISALTSQISHIPKVLYHWRKHARSTAQNDAAKPYTSQAQLLAIRRHMERIQMRGVPEILDNGLLHVRSELPADKLVSIIIPTKDRVDLLSRCVSSLLKLTAYERYEVIVVDNDSRDATTKQYLKQLEEDERFTVLWYPGAFNYSLINNRAAAFAKGDFLLFLNNDVEISDPAWLHELVLWADRPEIGVVGAKLLRANRTIQHAGVVVGMGGFADHPFADCTPLTFGIAGSTGWYRNWLAVTGACMLLRSDVFQRLGGFDQRLTVCGNDVDLCLRAYALGYRIVCNPFAELIHYEQQTRGANPAPDRDYLQSFESYKQWLKDGDPYWNPALSKWSRVPAFRYNDEQASADFAKRHLAQIHMPQETGALPATEEAKLVSWFDCSESDLRRLRNEQRIRIGYRSVKRVMWLVPSFEYGFYGGIYTILRFAKSWKQEFDVESAFAICSAADQQVMSNRIRAVYGFVEDASVFVIPTPEDARKLSPADACIATLWTTAYYGAQFSGAARRFYLIQDYEAAFYPAGSVSALVENTYRMGLYGIANTVSLKTTYEREYGGSAISFDPCINPEVFYPSPKKSVNERGPWQIFCYGRPRHPRNAFELLIAAMKRVKERLGARVHIVSAGDNWRPSDYGLDGVIENLGILDYADTARLYRESDLGAVFMLTRHPSYIPLELMACGCVTVTNRNTWTEWLLNDRHNCLLAPTTATAIADVIVDGLEDSKLRAHIRSNGIELVRSRYLDWNQQVHKVHDFLCDPEAILSRNEESVMKQGA